MAKRVHRVNAGGVAGKKCKDFRGQTKEFWVSLGFYLFSYLFLGFLFLGF